MLNFRMIQNIIFYNTKEQGYILILCKGVNLYMHNPTFRVMEILKLIGCENDLTLTDISEKLNFSKSTIQPILKTLLQLGYIVQDSGKRTYRIGLETFKISQNYLNDNTSLEMIKGHMKEIVTQCNEICQMGIFDNGDTKSVTYIAKEEPTQSVVLISNIGVSLPSHATALGKCLLSSFPNDYILEMYKDGMEKVTEDTVNDVNKLIDQLEYIRENQYIIEIGEVTEGILCVGIPLVQDQKVIASLSVSMPIYRSSDEKVEFLKELLLKHKKEIDMVLRDNPLVM